MSFIWPPLLLLLLAIPLGVWVYRSRERARVQRAAQFGWGALAAGAGEGSGRRAGGRLRRIPAVLTLAGVTILVLSLARPESVIGLPRFEGTVVLAFDVSGSMAATDVAPTRLEAAKTAALDFVEQQPPSVLIGIVVFSDTGFATQVPTADRVAIEAAIHRLEPQRGTSMGQGIDQALTVIEASEDAGATDYYTNLTEPRPDATPVPAGYYEPAIIVLLTDGENTVAPDPRAGAQEAKDRGIRIDTVGIGSEAGATLEVEGFLVHTQLDEAALRDIAATTDGTYYRAADEEDLTAIYDEVGSRLVVRTEAFELTPVLAALGFALLLIGGLTSLRWFGRMP